MAPVVTVEGIPVAIDDDADAPVGQATVQVACPKYERGDISTYMADPCAGQMQVDPEKLKHAGFYWEQPPHLGLQGDEGILRIVYHRRHPDFGPPLQSFMEEVPPQLRAKGVTDRQWTVCTKILQEKINPHV